MQSSVDWTPSFTDSHGRLPPEMFFGVERRMVALIVSGANC